jgi:hypothetical protein
MIKKFGLELRHWVISLILFSAMFGFMTLAFHDAATAYDATNLTNPEIEARYNNLEDQQDLVEGFKDTVSGDEGLQLFNLLGTVFTATIGVLNAVFSSVTFIPTVFANFASDFGIPTAVSNMFFTVVSLVLTTLLIFAVLNAIKR